MWAQVNKRFQERHSPPPAHQSGQPSPGSGRLPEPHRLFWAPSKTSLFHHLWAAPAKGAGLPAGPTAPGTRLAAPSLSTTPPPWSISKRRTRWHLLLPSWSCCTSGGGSKESKKTWGERLEVITRFAFLWSKQQFALMHVSWSPEVFLPIPLCLQLTRLETDHTTSQEQ